jgi:Holliday junction resolvasome RuvABC endonuclease subunit
MATTYTAKEIKATGCARVFCNGEDVTHIPNAPDNIKNVAIGSVGAVKWDMHKMIVITLGQCKLLGIEVAGSI